MVYNEVPSIGVFPKTEHEKQMLGAVAQGLFSA